jgi:hypothetical protein
MAQRTLVIDVPAVTDIAANLLQAGNELATLTRPMRLPLKNPASDPFTLRICTQLTHCRASLGILGCEAGDELTRMAEFILAAAFNLQHIARWTGHAARGITDAPLAPRTLAVTRAAVRADLPVEEPLVGWTIRNDAQALACAALLAAGDGDVPAPFSPSTSSVRALGESVRTYSSQMATAWANAESAAAKIHDFGHWICADLSAACEYAERRTNDWITLYAQTRSILGDAKVDRPADVAHSALNRYAEFISPAPELSDFPRLRV